MDKFKAFINSLGESGLRKAAVGLNIFYALVALRFCDKLENAIFGQCVMALIAVLLPAMAAEHFAPKE